MARRLLCGAIFLGALWEFVQAGNAQEKKAKSPEEGKKGTTIGMLVEVVVVPGKATYIEVKGDGEEKARKFFPQWTKADKGFEKAMVQTFKELKVGSRIEVDWVYEERLRALKVKVLKAAPDKKEK
jgi:hypothetical protein